MGGSSVIYFYGGGLLMGGSYVIYFSWRRYSGFDILSIVTFRCSDFVVLSFAILLVLIFVLLYMIPGCSNFVWLKFAFL